MPVSKAKKAIGHEGDGDIKCSRCIWNGHQMSAKETNETGNNRNNREYGDHSTVR